MITCEPGDVQEVIDNATLKQQVQAMQQTLIDLKGLNEELERELTLRGSELDLSKATIIKLTNDIAESRQAVDNYRNMSVWKFFLTKFKKG